LIENGGGAALAEDAVPVAAAEAGDVMEEDDASRVSTAATCNGACKAASGQFLPAKYTYRSSSREDKDKSRENEDDEEDGDEDEDDAFLIQD
jgi:hypothetical protein